MRMIIYNIILFALFSSFTVLDLQAADTTIQGPDVVEIPYIEESYVTFQCEDGSFIPYQDDTLTLTKEGTLMLQKDTKEQTFTIQAIDSQNNIITKDITIQSSWVIKQGADRYKIPENTATTPLQELDQFAHNNQLLPFLRLMIVFILLSFLILYIYIHNKVLGGDA